MLKAPKVHWDLTSARLLTMEFCEGGSVNDKAYLHDHNISSDEVSLSVHASLTHPVMAAGGVETEPAVQRDDIPVWICTL